MNKGLKFGLVGLSVLWAAFVGYLAMTVQGSAKPEIQQASLAGQQDPVCGSGPAARLSQADAVTEK